MGDMPRQAGLGTPGTLHHVVIRCIEQRKIVADNIDRRNFVDRMGYLSSETDTVIYAWVLLANHTHILLRSDLLGLLGSYQRSGKSAPKKLVLPCSAFLSPLYKVHGWFGNQSLQEASHLPYVSV